MKYWIDTEFIAKSNTIDLISIGVVAEDGREFYAESSEVDWLKASPWMLENVRPQLDGKGISREEIGYGLHDFTDGDEHPVFWGYFPAYDWVTLVGLFGGLEELPFHYPQLSPNCRTRRATGITPCSTRDGRGRPGRFSPASIPSERNGAPSAKRTPASSARCPG